MEAIELNLIGLMPVRNEDWILGMSARVALMWCDSLIVLNHASTDGSCTSLAEIEMEQPGRIILDSVGGEWDEMRHRQKLLKWAREEKATHIAIIDADEILTGNLLGSIRGHIEAAGANMLSLPGYNLRGGLNSYHSNGVWANRWFSTAFKDDPQASWSGDKFHSREPHKTSAWGHVQPVRQGDGGVMHMWGASERRLIAKHALYKVMERLRWPDKPVAEIDRMYSWAIKGEDHPNKFGTPATWTYAAVPDSWWNVYAEAGLFGDLLGGLRFGGAIRDREPWQEAEVRRLVTEHGRERFEGLDLFGVAA
jgi:Glycosyl transferase family 2